MEEERANDLRCRWLDIKSLPRSYLSPCSAQKFGQLCAPAAQSGGTRPGGRQAARASDPRVGPAALPAGSGRLLLVAPPRAAATGGRARRARGLMKADGTASSSRQSAASQPASQPACAA